jgi:uncharacterized paraquat-inducible protein A
MDKLCNKYIATGGVKSCEHFKEERKGRWERVIPTKSAAKWSTKVSCSVCHRQGYTHHRYCPHCGADMRGKEDG